MFGNSKHKIESLHKIRHTYVLNVELALRANLCFELALRANSTGIVGYSEFCVGKSL